MRPSLLLSLPAFAAASLFAAPTAPAVPDYPAALASAKKQNRPLLLLADGPGFAPDSAQVRRELTEELARRNLPVVFGVHEYAPDDALKSAKSAAPELTPWNFPALIIVGTDGHTFAIAEGLRAGKVAAVLDRVPATLENYRKRDDLWTRAKSASAVERATLLGAGLDLMPDDRARERKDILASIREADPQDASGYAFKYTFDAASWHESVVDKAIADKKTDVVLAEISARLANQRITAEQRQLLLTGRFQIRLAADDVPGALATLRDIIGVAPDSDMGKGAASYLRRYTDPVRLETSAWRQADNRPAFTPMLADLSASVKTAGTYEIEFRHKSGHTRFRKTELVAGGKTVASDDNAEEKSKLRLVVKSNPAGPVTLRVESRGTGWFDGAGDIVVTKVD